MLRVKGLGFMEGRSGNENKNYCRVCSISFRCHFRVAGIELGFGDMG